MIKSSLIVSIIASALPFIPSAPHRTIDGVQDHKPVQMAEAKENPVIEPRSELKRIPLWAAGGNCAAEILKYDWNQEVAYNVMMVESSNKPTNLNDNPKTGDYSVGCFQINLYGSNLQAKYGTAKSLGYTGGVDRDSLQEWLWNAENNVKVAYTMWRGSGWGPWNFTTCKKVACY